MTYEGQHVDCRNYPWFARTFNKPHHEIENDARVWKQIAAIIDSRLSSRRSPMDQVGNQRSPMEPGLSLNQGCGHSLRSPVVCAGERLQD